MGTQSQVPTPFVIFTQGHEELVVVSGGNVPTALPTYRSILNLGVQALALFENMCPILLLSLQEAV